MKEKPSQHTEMLYLKHLRRFIAFGPWSGFGLGLGYPSTHHSMSQEPRVYERIYYFLHSFIFKAFTGILIIF